MIDKFIAYKSASYIRDLTELRQGDYGMYNHSSANKTMACANSSTSQFQQVLNKMPVLYE